MKTTATCKSGYVGGENSRPDTPEPDNRVEVRSNTSPQGALSGLARRPQRETEGGEPRRASSSPVRSSSYPSITKPQKLENQKRPIMIFDSVEPSRIRSTTNLAALDGINQEGLDRISMTGIEQFSEAQLDDVIKSVYPKTVVVIDTRQEAHGFVSGKPVSWMALDNKNWGNVDKPMADIEPKEEKKLSKWVRKNDGEEVSIPNGSTAKVKRAAEPLTLSVSSDEVETEKRLVTRKGGIYIRVPVPDHAAPDEDALAHFAASTRSVVMDKGLENVHFVVHCRGGMGRTTMFMSALDMLTNAGDVPMKEIVDRQVKLRQRDEGSITAAGKAYKATFRDEKAAVLQFFYDYAAANRFGSKDAKSLEAWSADQGDALRAEALSR
ncbi:hypothetical protein [Xanthomonas vasicola]|uniref:phosphatase domain-containing protein n=2 Tax=Xanthomonas vasicola TaxID=56459 RepID=UPI0001CBF177|nr:hypothetical protein [Xanthomonas vasicola]